MLVNLSNTVAAFNGETEQKFTSGRVSSKSGAEGLHLNRPSLATEQEFIFSLEGLSSSLSR